MTKMTTREWIDTLRQRGMSERGICQALRIRECDASGLGIILPPVTDINGNPVLTEAPEPQAEPEPPQPARPRPPLSPLERALLLTIRRVSPQVSNAELAEICGTTRGVIGKYIEKLVAKGYVKRELHRVGPIWQRTMTVIEVPR